MTRRHALSGKDVKALARSLPEPLSKLVLEADVVEVYETEDATIYLADGRPIVATIEVSVEGRRVSKTIPLLTLFYLVKPEGLRYPYVRVDDGAVPRIVNGADVMRPGIVEFGGEFNRDDVVIVKDVRDRVIAVGIALVDSKTAAIMSKGKVIKNVHHLGDDIWSECIEISRSRAESKA